MQGMARSPTVLRRTASVHACCLAGLVAIVGATVRAGDVAPAVLEAQQQRIDVMQRAAATAVAIFAGEAGGGSGVLISPAGYALTNFHVVQPAGVAMKCGLADGRLYDAVLVGLDPTGDVALIKLLGRDDFPAAEFADSDDVEVGDFCFAAGNPFLLATDFQPSISAGIVSGTRRYQFPAGTILEYADCLQVDAAINPGNSGGPVLQGGKVVGVAFQGFSGRVAQNVGYMIPVPVIKRFLKDIEDGRYDHYVDLAASDFPIENPAQAKALGTHGGGVGVMVADVEPAGSVGEILKIGDVILSIDDNPVLNNGLVRFEGELMDMNEIVERKFAGDKIKLEFLRGGKKQEATVTLKRFDPYVRLGATYNQRPRYVVFAGLVFQPMDRNLMDAHQIRDRTVSYVFDNFLTNKLYVERPEPVVLTNVLPDEVNTWLTPYAHSIVDEINGVKIKSLKDVQSALAKKDQAFIEIRLLEKSRPLVLKRELAEAAHPRIMQTYNIQGDSFVGEE